MAQDWWKRFHYTTYAAAAVFFLHGVIADPLLQGRPADLIANPVHERTRAFLSKVAA